MNKTEKLLAARKKLKEFQMNKIIQYQEVTSHPQNNEQKIDTSQANNSIAISDEKNCYTNHSGIHFDSENQLSHSHDLVTNHVENPCVAEPLIDLNTSETNFVDNFQISENKFQDSQIIKSNRESSDFFNIRPNEKESNSAVNTSAQIELNFYSNESSTEAASIDNSSTTQNRNSSDVKLHVADIVTRDDKVQSIPTNDDLERKVSTEQLHDQVNQYSNELSMLRSLVAEKETEFTKKLAAEINPLKEEIQVHTQTINILVAEKAELSAACSQYQSLAQYKSEEANELREKLKSTQSHVTELEKELAQSKSFGDQLRQMYNELQSNYTSLCEQFEELKKVKEEQQLEISELRQDLNFKSIELTKHNQEIAQTKNLLSLAELKIQQLTNMPEKLQVLEVQQHERTTLEQQLSQLRENYKSVTMEKDEMCKHYESYVKQLDTKYENASLELKAAQKTISELEGREESLIQRLSLMEQQYQREKQKVESLLPLQSHEEHINHLTKSMDALMLEHESLERAFREKESEIESITEELQELRELRDQSIETSKLVSALESEQLGASRAVSQNQQLKLQLNEMHDAFVMLSNSKLNLTEQLQDERVVGRKLNGQLSRVEAEMDELKAELIRKDAIIEELNKEKLHSAQIADQMHHYQVQSYQARTLQDELQSALSTIESLKNENQLLTERIQSLSQNLQKSDSLHLENDEEILKKNAEEELSGIKNTQIEQQTELDKPLLNLNNHDSDAKKKLERRFKDTMDKVAELTDEKQRLEHLVLQLQSETETIGEYITLYQKQRSILQAKAQERENTFRQLLEQRNKQQVQLHKLKVLVAELLQNKDNVNSLSQSEHKNSHLPFLNENENHKTDVQTLSTSKAPDVLSNTKADTTAKILDLLTEIKDCKDTCSLEPNFHPCLWCSGKLITV